MNERAFLSCEQRNYRPKSGLPRIAAGVDCCQLACAGCVLLGMGLPSAAAQNPTPAGVEVTAGPEQISQWVRDLDGNRFVVRRNATDALIRAGRVAVEPLLAAMAKGSLEVSTRGVYVLKALATSRDAATEEAAVAALHQLSTSTSPSTARQAAEAITALGAVRQQRALTELEELGAQITTYDNAVFLAQVNSLRLEIGLNWRGTVADLERFRWLPDVQEVHFVGPQVTDEWVRNVEFLSGVTKVVIKHGRITDDSVRTLCKIKHLSQVYLMYTPVTDGAWPICKP